MSSLAALLSKYKDAPAEAPKPPLTDRLGMGRGPVEPEHTIISPSTLNERLAARRRAPERTDELLRIDALPRRLRPTEEQFAAMQRRWDSKLRIDSDVAPCDCSSRWGFCIKHLNEIQAWTCEEFSQQPGGIGIVGKIGIGTGKTGLDILLAMCRPGIRNALLLLKPSLVDQFIEVDFPQWSAHFRTPNLDSRYSKVYNPDRPTLHVYSYAELSHKNNTDLLDRIQFDLIIADEAQNLGNRKSSRGIRFLRACEENTQTAFVPLSGSFNAKGVAAHAHLYGLALRESSPLPIDELTVKLWGKAVDPAQGAETRTIGALEAFCKPGEDVVEGLGRRVNETFGVISSVELSCKLPLKITTRRPLPLPTELADAMAKTRATGARPDGEEAETAFQKALWLREMACGFFYRFRFPNGEPEELILQWFGARKNWHKEIRDTMGENPESGLDSPALLTNAAARYHRGYKGKLPVWAAVCYQPWMKIKDRVKPVESIVWMDDHMLNDAVAWAKERKDAGEGGIIWCEFTEIGKRIAKAIGVDYYNGQEWGAALRQEKGDRVVVCSIRGFGTGTNLQRFTRHLVISNPASAETWQQLLGRPHRQGQTKPVWFEVYRHTPELRSALDKAIERAEWIERFDKEEQKLCFADSDW